MSRAPMATRATAIIMGIMDVGPPVTASTSPPPPMAPPPLYKPGPLYAQRATANAIRTEAHEPCECCCAAHERCNDGHCSVNCDQDRVRFGRDRVDAILRT